MPETPIQDPEHKALWDALSELKAEISVNGYGPILRSLAQRELRRQAFWETIKKPASVAAKLVWIIAGAVVWAVFNHLSKAWPTPP